MFRTVTECCEEFTEKAIFLKSQFMCCVFIQKWATNTIRIANVHQPLRFSRSMRWILNVEFGQQVWLNAIWLISLVMREVILWTVISHFQTALYNDLDKLQKFIESGQTNKADATGYTALHYAARNGHLTACEQLLNAGAEVNACTRSGGVTPLIRAALMGNIEYF